jgi:hypothetical protein
VELFKSEEAEGLQTGFSHNGYQLLQNPVSGNDEPIVSAVHFTLTLYESMYIVCRKMHVVFGN